MKDLKKLFGILALILLMFGFDWGSDLKFGNFDFLEFAGLSSAPSNPPVGKVRFFVDSTDGKFKKLDSNGDISTIAGGGSVGSASIYGLFNGEDKKVVDFVNITSNETTPIAGVADYSVNAYPASIPDVPLYKRNLNKRNTLSIEYTITSGTAKIAISGGGLANPVEVEIDNTDTRTVIEFTPTDDATDLSIDITDVSSATGLKIDDLEFSDSQRLVKNFTVTETVTYTGFLSKGAGDYVKFKTELENNANNIISVDNSGDRTQYTLLKDADIVVTSSIYSLDASENNMKIEVYDAGNFLVIDGISRNEYHGTTSITLRGKAGYFFLVDAESRTPEDLVTTNFSMQATAISSGTVFASDNVPSSTVERKILSSNFSTTGTITDFTFITEVGKQYNIGGRLKLLANAKVIDIEIRDGATVIDTIGYNNDTYQQESPTLNKTYTATSTSLTFEVTTNNGVDIYGNGTLGQSYIELKEETIKIDNLIVDIDALTTNHVAGGTEYELKGQLWNGKQIYARSYETTVTTLTGNEYTLFSIDSGLEIISMQSYGKTSLYWYRFGDSIPTTGGSWARYEISNGAVKVRLDGETTTEQKTTIKYTKP